MCCLLAVMVSCVCFSASLHAAESPFVGTWKVIALPPGSEVTLWLVEVSEKEGRLQASVAAPKSSSSEVTFVKTDDKAVRLGIKTPYLSYSLVGYLPKGKDQPTQLLGSLEARGRRDMLRLERTDQRELPPGGVVAPSPAAEPLAHALTLRNSKEREAALRQVLTAFPGQSATFQAALELLALGMDDGGAEAELRVRADQVLKAAAIYGREMVLQANVQVARQLARGERHALLALDYARKGQGLLTEDDPPAVQVRALRTAGLALRKTGQVAAAKPLESRADQLDETLDRQYEQASLPFAVEPARSGAPPSRLIVVELFSSSSCPFCVAADTACIGLARTFDDREVTILAYHLPVPGPDPLANHDGEQRARYYNVQATAALLINGKIGPVVGGSLVEAKDRYDDLRKAVSAQVPGSSPIKLKVTATRRGDKVDIQTEVAEAPASENLRLRLVLAEETVRYPGPNGQRLHHHVVRALLGGAEGLPLRAKSLRQTTTISLQGVAKSLQDYLDDFAKPYKFLEDERPLELKHLKVVALVQDDKTKEVLQAAQAEVPER